MTPFEKLDAVLKCLEAHHSEQHHNFESIAKILEKEQPEIQFGEITSIFTKLHRDKLIDIKEVQIPNTASKESYYRINFEGRVFNEQGGYVEQNNEKNRLNMLSKQQRRTSVQLVRLTVLLAISAIGTLVYYGVELYWKYRWFQDAQSWWIFFLSLVIGGGTACLVTKRLNRKR